MAAFRIAAVDFCSFCPLLGELTLTNPTAPHGVSLLLIFEHLSYGETNCSSRRPRN
jgi:hypothetical protein